MSRSVVTTPTTTTNLPKHNAMTQDVASVGASTLATATATATATAADSPHAFTGTLAADTFSRLMSPLCLHTLLEFLTPHERIASRVVSHQFAVAVVRSSLWSRSVYQHDSIKLTTALPISRSPFQRVESVVSQPFLGLLPPKWIRQSIGGIRVYNLDTDEAAHVLPLFSSIRSLTIKVKHHRSGEVGSSGDLRHALSALRRLEELSVEYNRDETLLTALFSTSENDLVSPSSDDPTNERQRESPAIWSYHKTLRRLVMTRLKGDSTPRSLTFRVFAETMSGYVWSQLEHLECLDYAEMRDEEERTRLACEKLFSVDTLPQLKHLIVRGYRFQSSDAVNASRVTGGIQLPQLIELHHSIRSSFGAPPTFGAFGVPAAGFTFGAPAAPAFGALPTFGFGAPAFGVPPPLLPPPAAAATPFGVTFGAPQPFVHATATMSTPRIPFGGFSEATGFSFGISAASSDAVAPLSASFSFGASHAGTSGITFVAPTTSTSSTAASSSSSSSSSGSSTSVVSTFSFDSNVRPLFTVPSGTNTNNKNGFSFGREPTPAGTDPTATLFGFGASAPSSVAGTVTATPTSVTPGFGFGGIAPVTAVGGAESAVYPPFGGFTGDTAPLPPAGVAAPIAAKSADSEPIVEYSSGLIYMELEQYVTWNSLVRLSRLTHLVIGDIVNMLPLSLELFESIGHHALPHLATLSIPCLAEAPLTAADTERVFNLMSRMTSLTSIHSQRVNYADSLTQLGFQWFVHLYQFPSLQRIAFFVAGSLREYRIVPLPLPREVTLAPNQHRLYPSGGIYLPRVPTGRGFDFQSLLEPPSWLVIDPPTTPSRFERAPFTSLHQPAKIEYIDADKFRDGAREYQAKMKETEADAAATMATKVNEDQIMKNQSLSTVVQIDHFTPAMTDLCMALMLTYLPALEIARTLTVSRHFHRSALHSAVWKNATFRVTRSHALPSPAVCALIGSLNVPMLGHSTASEMDLLSHFPSLRRLCFSITSTSRYQYPNAGFSSQESSSSPPPSEVIASLLSSLHLESLTVMIGRLDPQEIHSGNNEWTYAQMNKIWQLFFEAKDSSIGKLPIIYSFADSLKQLELTIFFGSVNHAILALAMNQCVWNALESFDIRWIPFLMVEHLKDSQLPFEHLLTHANDLLPQLRSLGLEYPQFINLPNDSFPLASLNRIFRALASNQTLSRLRHSFPDLIEDQDCFSPVYPSSLTALSIVNQVAWNQVAKLSSLTELRLAHISNAIAPALVFECIGHQSMPLLTTLSIECSTHVYTDALECTRESERVRHTMSQMTSLTQLHSERVSYRGVESSTSFCWFVHAYLFPSLERVEYLHDDGETQYQLWRHTLLPIPTSSTLDSSLIMHHLLPSPSQFQPPHIYCPVRKTLHETMIEHYHSITAQSEYTHTSFDELRLEHLLEKEKAEKESRVYQPKLLRDTRVKFASSLPASLIAVSKDDASFTVIPKKTELSSSSYWDHEVPTAFPSSTGFASLQPQPSPTSTFFLGGPPPPSSTPVGATATLP